MRVMRFVGELIAPLICGLVVALLISRGALDMSLYEGLFYVLLGTAIAQACILAYRA